MTTFEIYGEELEIDVSDFSKYNKNKIIEDWYIIYDWSCEEFVVYDENNYVRGIIDRIKNKGYFNSEDSRYLDEWDCYCIDSIEPDYFGLYFSESRDGYYSDDESNSHTVSYDSADDVDKSEGAEWRVGFEIEKEDYYIKESVYHEDIYCAYGWAKEEDSSLNDSGFELVSPVYDLYGSKMYDGIEAMKDAINADISERCGFHFNISNRELYDYKDYPESKHRYSESRELFKQYFSHYVLLFYALYPERTNIKYSKKKNNKEYMFNATDKYAAFNLQKDRLEIRIFKAIEDVSELLWNIKLIKYIIENPKKNSLGLFSDVKLKELVSERYDYDEIMCNMLRESTYKESTINKLIKIHNLDYDHEFVKDKFTMYKLTETGQYNFKEELDGSYMFESVHIKKNYFNHILPLFYFGTEEKYNFKFIRYSKSGKTKMYGNNNFIHLYNSICAESTEE